MVCCLSTVRRAQRETSLTTTTRGAHNVSPARKQATEQVYCVSLRCAAVSVSFLSDEDEQTVSGDRVGAASGSGPMITDPGQSSSEPTLAPLLLLYHQLKEFRTSVVYNDRRLVATEA